MSTHIPQSAEPVREEALTELFEKGCKPRSAWRIGTEYEKFVVDSATGHPVSYDGPHGIRALLEYLAAEHGWTPYREDGYLIALQRNGESISLEPGGQFELSGAPLRTLDETAAEFDRHVAELDGFAAKHPVRYCWKGVHPTAELDTIDWMPKARYGIMRAYLPPRGALAVSMMKLTCTVQANVDYSSEQDAFHKFRLGMVLTPLVSALYGNSSLTAGRPSGYESWRQHIWTAVDPDRCGQLDFAYGDSDGAGFFAAYAAWAASVPMFFVHRLGRYVDVAGIPFRSFAFDRSSAGDLPGRTASAAHVAAARAQRPATQSDWELHLSTLFPDVRLKNYLEVRAADCVPAPYAMSVPALWKGLLYDEEALQSAWKLAAGAPFEAHVHTRDEAARLGLDAPVAGGTASLRELGRDIVGLARDGLRRQSGDDSAAERCSEETYLEPLFRLLEGGYRSVGHALAEQGETGCC